MTDLSSKELRELILKADDIKKEPVTIPEWKDANGKPITVYLKQATGGEKDTFEEESAKANKDGWNLKNARARMVIKALIDKDGNRIFSDDPKELAYLSSKSGAVLDRLIDKFLKLNRITNDDLEAQAKN